MKSIWFFVGLTLSIMGVFVLIAGIVDYISPRYDTPLWGSSTLPSGETRWLRFTAMFNSLKRKEPDRRRTPIVE